MRGLAPIVPATMGELLNLELEQKAVAVRERLNSAVAEYGRVVYSSSLGAESIVLTDIIWSHVPGIDIFTIDTGRLPEEGKTIQIVSIDPVKHTSNTINVLKVT